MNHITRNKTLLFIIVLLLLTNGALLFLMFGGNKKQGQHEGKPKPGITEALRREVGFTDEQIAQFNQIKENNWGKVRQNLDKIRQTKQSIFNLVKDTTVSDSTILRLADSIGNLQRAVEINAFNHFKTTRSICNSPEQQTRYDSFVTKLISQGKAGGPNSRR